MKYSSFFLIFLSCFSNQIHALEGPKSASDFHILQFSSLLPASACTDHPSTTKGQNNKQSTIKVFHRHGPCFRQGKDESTAATPSLIEVFSQDQSRVDSIHARLAPKSSKNKDMDGKYVEIPANSGETLNAGNYVVTLGLGTPASTLSLIFDTGSDLTWTQCQPCIQSCYEQQDPIFDPSGSSSYSNISCNSTQCSQLLSATGYSPRCHLRSTCMYSLRYGDGSFSDGYFSKDTLSLSDTDVIPDFLFGCGQNNRGLFGRTAGLIGLGRDPLSLPSQTAQQYGKYFSYCLPSVSSSTGHLTLGKTETSNNINFTPFANSQGTSFYFIDLIAITVGGSQLPINQSVFKTAGTIIDSGTVVTRLPPDIYSAMRSAFRQLMAKYPSAPAYTLLDTCYELSDLTNLTVPKVAFTFGGNVVVDLDPSGILYAVNSNIGCLAFAANSPDINFAIIGNTQQKTLEVAYDVAGGNLGFGSNGCS